MTESTKIEFRHRRIRQLEDFADLAEILFPGNANQRHAAACILHELKWFDRLVPNLAYLETRHDISRRTLQRARAKLSRLGLIERIGWMNSRSGGEEGWKLSTRFASALRCLADKTEIWTGDTRPDRRQRERLLVELLNPRPSVDSASAGARPKHL